MGMKKGVQNGGWRSRWNDFVIEAGGTIKERKE